MDLFNIIIDNKKFIYIDSITINKRNYVAFMNDENVFVNEYKITDRNITFNDIDEQTYEMVIKELDL